MPDSITRLSGLRSGDLDAIVLDPSQVDEVKGEGDYELLSRTTLQVDRFYLNRGAPPFDNPLVRQAVNHAINRQAIVDAVVFGQGEPVQQQFPSEYYASSPDVGPDYYSYDPDEARRLLTEAGYPDGFEYVQIVPSGPTYEPVAEAVMSQLREVGIEATPRLVEPAASVTAYVVDQEGQATMGATGGRADPSMLFQLLFMPDGFFNPGKQASQEVQDLFAKQLGETDPAARETEIHDLVDQIAEEALDVPLYALVNNIAVSDRVQGLQAQLIGFAGMEFRGVSVS
jgi:peptide/nickel transport system substrate-binding protein